MALWGSAQAAVRWAEGHGMAGGTADGNCRADLMICSRGLCTFVIFVFFWHVLMIEFL